MNIRFDEAHGSVRIYDGTRYLVLFGAEKYDLICNKIRYFKGVKNGITYLFLIIMQEYKNNVKNILLGAIRTYNNSNYELT